MGASWRSWRSLRHLRVSVQSSINLDHFELSYIGTIGIIGANDVGQLTNNSMSCKAKRSVRMLITSSPFGDQVGKICTGTKRPRLLASNLSPWHDRVGNFLSAASKCPLNHLNLQTTLYNINKSNVAKTGGRLAHLTGP